MKWKIEYDNDTGPNDDYLSEWYTVTDGVMRFRCDTKEDAEWLAKQLNEKSK